MFILFDKHFAFLCERVLKCTIVLNSVITLQLQLCHYLWFKAFSFCPLVLQLASVRVQGGGQCWSSRRHLTSVDLDITFVLLCNKYKSVMVKCKLKGKKQLLYSSYTKSALCKHLQWKMLTEN